MKHDKLTKELFEKWNKIQGRKDIPIKTLIKENSLSDLEQNNIASPSDVQPQLAKPIAGAIPVHQDWGDTLVVSLSGSSNDYDEYKDLPNAVLYKGKKYYKASFDSDKHYAVYKIGNNFATALPESKKITKNIREQVDSLKSEAIQYLISTYDFNPAMDPYETLAEFEADNDIKFTRQERQEIVQAFRQEWARSQRMAGVKRPLSPSERAKAFRDIENVDDLP